MREHLHKTLGTSIIYSPKSLPQKIYSIDVTDTNNPLFQGPFSFATKLFSIGYFSKTQLRVGTRSLGWVWVYTFI